MDLWCLLMELKAFNSFQEMKRHKAVYDSSNNATELAAAESNYTAALTSTIIKGTAGLVLLGATGAFVSMKGISTDGRGLVFSGTW